MKKLTLTLVAALFATGALACTTSSYITPDGKMGVCTTCCDANNNCTTTCV